MSTNFEGKVIAITGAASGIGLATAKMLAQRGAILAIADIAGPGLETATKAIHALNPSAKVGSTVVNVRDRAAVETWISAIVKEHGRLDGAANLAGVIGKQIGIANIEDVDDDDWDFVMGVNVNGVLNCLRAELRAMKANPKVDVAGKRGSIVNAASVAGIIGMKKNVAYVASKHAVVGLTRSAAKESGGDGIRVNCIAPGPINTPMVADAKTKAPFRYADFAALEREGQPEEVAELICWLLCDGSSYMSGTVQSIDGGWAC